MTDTIMVEKRDGSLEPLNLEKLHKMTFEATDGLAGVSASQVEMNSGLQFFDGIKSSDIQQILVKSASDLISLDSPNYQYVAARLLLFATRKDALGKFEYSPLLDVIKMNVERGVYDPSILEKYTEEEINWLDKQIKHKRDMNFTYAGLRQIVDKYLVQDRSSGAVFETPQYMYMLIAATMFAEYEENERLSYVKR